MRADRDISKLDPDFKEKVDLFLKEVEPMGVFVTEAKRSAARQLYLRARGLSKVKVSNHQLGKAIDIAFKDDTRTKQREAELYPSDMKRWREVADIGIKYGIEWGYDLWKWDKPHFQDNGDPLTPNREIEDNEKILAQRMDAAWNALDSANAAKKYLSQLKNKKYKPYIITESDE